jgi:UDPglucose 6-dehydrogenase
MKITVFGTGYVGLVTGACLADAGHDLLCVDVDEAKINGLNQGIIPIYEPGLDFIVRENHRRQKIRFTSSLSDAVKFGELLFIAVGTPPDEDGSADLRYVLSVANSIAEYMDEPKIIVNKSTVPVGTADKVRQRISEVLVRRNANFLFEVCSNPEFLKEGSAIEDFRYGSRFLVGTASDWVRARMGKCYEPFSCNGEKLMFMDIRSAELTKYAANAMLATKISFMSELSNLSEHLGADMENVRKGIGSDPRIGYDFMNPGCGYGGSCFPKDVQALLRIGDGLDYNAELLKAVESVNKRQKTTLYSKLKVVFNEDFKDKTIAIWGLSFKPNTDDMREAPSRILMESLWIAGAKVQAYDPEAMEETLRIYGERADLKLASTRDAAIKGADVLVVCTEWDQFKNVDFDWLKEQLTIPAIVDGRNIFDLSEVKKAGLMYYGVGRGDSLVVYDN